MKKHYLAKKLIAMMITASMVISVVTPITAAIAQKGNQNYVGNQGELLETPFINLPLGAVNAHGWLENQLLLQKNGLTGHMNLFNEYNANTSAWLGKVGGEDWERGPYYMRGLVALAYALDDDDLIKEAQKWVDWSIDNQRSDGYFGPANNSWWSRMPVLMAIRDYYEATEAKGETDSRVLPFMEKYFRYQAEELKTRRLSNWADARGGDNIDSVYWLYNRLYDANNPQTTKWLLDLGDLLLSQTTDWTNQYNNTTVRQHVVNTSQGMKTPPVYYQYNQSENYRTALVNGLFNMGIDHGRIDGLPNSDEAARDNRSTRGSETCGIVEGLLSTEISERIFGDAWLGDRIEQLAYNSLPAAFTPEFSGHTYYVLQNQVLATTGSHEFDNDHGDSSAFGAPLGFDCCFSNFHMGWPKFVQTMWMATKNNGLALTAYGPNSVTATVANGKTAKFLQETDYPFKDSVGLTYGGETVAFELQLRIPTWAIGATVKVNGLEQNGVVSGEYYIVNREWKFGDVVELNFPSEIKTSTWYNDSVAVEKGALIYGLKIEEDWRINNSNAERELKVTPKEEYPLREIFAASPWNYGLIVDEANPESSFEIVTTDSVAMQPFTTDTAPITLKAKGQILPEWVLDGNLVGPQPFGPTKYDETMIRDIELIPYGSGRLRISHFPKIGDAQETIIKSSEVYGKTIQSLGKTYLEFDNIVVPSANDYTLKVIGSGSGNIIINGKYSQTLSFDGNIATITGLKSKLSGYFAFNAGQYNNIRFDSSLNIESIELIPVERTIGTIEIISSTRTSNNIKIMTNLNAQETPYRVEYGTNSNNYSHTMHGFETGTATITGIDRTKTYYAKVITSIGGVEVASDELVFNPTSGGGGLQPNPNVPVAQYTGFNSLNYMYNDWKFYDPENKISYDDSSGKTNMIFGRGSKVKSALEIAGTDKWVDYVVEADVSVDLVDNNSAGIMFRASNIGTEPDAYQGFFAGIGLIDSRNVEGMNGAQYRGSGVMIGYADGGWHDIKPIKYDIKPGQKYTLKIVAYGENFAFYIDNEFVTTFTSDLFAKGTVGLRSYNEAFKAYDLRVKPISEDDLKVFQDNTTVGLQPNKDAANATYQGFGSIADVNNNWIKYDPTGKIQITDNTGKTNIRINKGTQNKIVLAWKDDITQKATPTNPLTWTDFVVETKVTVDEITTNNCGIMLRATDIGDGPDAYKGYFVGIGYIPGNIQSSGLMIGHADGNGWHDINPIKMDIKAGVEYTLKVVAYGQLFAIYIDNVLISTFENSLYTKGTVGLRSYNEAFTANEFTVRNITKTDLAVFEESVEPVDPDQPDYTQPNFSDNFEDIALSNSLWTKVGATNLISVADGKISLESSTNVKATAGEDTWENFVYEADITLGSGNGNAGLIYRTTNESAGADSYYGYYFGITSAARFEVGVASNNWKQLLTGDFTPNPNGTNRLKVIGYKDTLLLYINDKFACRIIDTTHTAGKIGLRGYNKAFTADNIVVRPLTPDEFQTILNPELASFEISATSCSNTIQTRYLKASGATTYKIQYGKASGIYTNEIVDIWSNKYTGGSAFTADKAGFSVNEPGTYFVRMVAMSGSTEIAYSNEVQITTDFTEATLTDSAKLLNELTISNNIDTTSFTKTSLQRLESAREFANKVISTQNSSQMDLSLATHLLQIARLTPASADIDYSVADNNLYTEITMTKLDNIAIASFKISNNTAENIKLALIVATYDSSGKMIGIELIDQIVSAKSPDNTFDIAGNLPNGCVVKAFIWRMAYENFLDSYVPMNDSAEIK